MLAQLIQQVCLKPPLFNKDGPMVFEGVLHYPKPHHHGQQHEYNTLLVLDHQPSENPLGT